MDEPTSSKPPPPPGFLEEWRARFQAVTFLPVVLSIIWQSGRILVSAGLALRVAASFIPLGILGVSKVIVDAVAAKASGKQLPDHFWLWVGLEVILALTAATFGRCAWYIDTVLAETFSHHLSIRIMEHASSLDIVQYEDAAFQDTLERARLQATDRAPLISSLGMVIQQAFTGASYCVAIIWFSPLLLGVLTLGLLPSLAGESHYAFLGYSLATSQTEARRRLDYLRLLGAGKESAKELKLFALAGFLTARFRDLSTHLFNQNRSLWRRRLIVGTLLSMVAVCGYYGAFIYVVYLAVLGTITVGSLTLLGGSIAGANSTLQGLFSTFSNIADQTLFLKHLQIFFSVRPVLPVSPNPRPAPVPVTKGFRFENVTFRYPGSERPVLDNFNLSIAAGERVALVGENGQGKTTIIKLLTRLYDPTEGRILLDDVDLREYDPGGLLRQFSVLFQDFMRYDMEAEQNIGIGHIDLQGPDKKALISDAAHWSGAGEVIERLPRKMEQMLGRRFEGGMDLSGGEWQKVALARTYLRNAQILILDEPTAALDAKSEADVFEHFVSLTEGKTALLISHRFSTVRMVDRIIVIKGGHIAEEGTHDALMALGGIYSSMFELQASSYR